MNSVFTATVFERRPFFTKSFRHGGVRWRVAFGLFSRIYCNYLGYGISIIYIPHFPPTSRLVLVLPIPHYLPYRQAVSIICSGRLFSTKNYIIIYYTSFPLAE